MSALMMRHIASSGFLVRQGFFITKCKMSRRTSARDSEAGAGAAVPNPCAEAATCVSS